MSVIKRVLPSSRAAWDVIRAAVYRFTVDDGWAIASHIALSALVAFFPFMIVLTMAATALGTEEAAAQAVQLIVDSFPERLAIPLANEVRTVVSGGRDLLTVSIIMLVWLSSSGVEALRVGLNRAYGVLESRSWIFCRLQSVLFVVVGLASALVLGVLILFWPIAAQRFPTMLGGNITLDVLRYTTATVLVGIALLSAHRWIPAGNRRSRTIWPGIAVTLGLWLLTATIFGYYMAAFFENYAATYAGLAGIMATLLYLYIASAIFILGGNLNAAILAYRRGKPADAPSPT